MPATVPSPGPAREASSASSTSSGETARATDNPDPTPVDLPSPADESGTTPTANLSSQLASTPPASSSARPNPRSASSARTASSPTPNPHRRTLSSASSAGGSTAPPSNVNSPARRDYGASGAAGPSDLSDSILHEESGEDGDESFFTADAPNSAVRGAGSTLGVRRPSGAGPAASRARPPSTSLLPPSTGGNFRRSISVNTSASAASQAGGGAASPALGTFARPSLPHPHSSARLSIAPSTAPHSRARTPGAGATLGRRSVSRAGRISTTASEASSDEEAHAEWTRSSRGHGYDAELASAPPARRREQVKSDGEEDGAQTRDRGEELVRKRMRERKEARKAAQTQRMRDESTRRISAYTQGSSAGGDFDDRLGLGFPSATGAGPSANLSAPRTRDPSVARSERSHTAASLFSDGGGGPRSPIFAAPHQAQPWSPLGIPHHQHAPYSHVPRPSLGSRGASYLSSASATSHASDTEGPTGTQSGRGGAGSVVEGETEGEGDEGELSGQDPRMEDWDDGGADGTHADDSGEEVEYTLKDRQDAINVEHPFGLPIWKPALYKKSRSIARHAESALHAAPSSTALHHLLPSNLVWTVSLGTPLFALCALVSAVLFITPFGGSKYGRVVWELGTYLFWPFGKYVEGWTSEPHDIVDEAEHDDDEHDVDPLHPGRSDEDADEEEAAGRGAGPSYSSDPEAAGQTFRRGRSGTINGLNTASTTSNLSRPSLDGVFASEHDGASLPDEPLRRSDRTYVPHERSALLAPHKASSPRAGYGTRDDKNARASTSSSDETAVGYGGIAPHDFSKDDDARGFRVRALGRLVYWATFYLVVAPVMLVVAAICWGCVFTIPMARLLWVLLRHLNNEPLSLHFRSPPEYAPVAQDLATDLEAPDVHADGPTHHAGSSIIYPLRAGQPAPPLPRQSLVADKRKGRLRGPHPTVLLCTYRAAGREYYKYTVDGVNVWFVNLLALVFLAIADFFLLMPYVERTHPHGGAGFLGLLVAPPFVFSAALLSVIPLSYFLGMAVASISAQSSIGVGAVINASFGSVIEIILYGIALTQAKGELVEGSIVGSILAGVLLMPGLSMIAGAFRRKEQRFNARAAGVTSTMLIMALIGTLTPTLFYEIYGSFQLTCNDCDLPTSQGGPESCRSCYYEHVSPADDPFYRQTVVRLSYYCAILLVLSYLIGLWFSLKTHASQIWQNAAPSQEHARPLSTAHPHPQPATAADRRSLYQRIVPSQLFQQGKHRASPLATPHLGPSGPNKPGESPHQLQQQPHAAPPLQLPDGLTPDELNRAFQVVASAASALHPQATAPHLRRSVSHARDQSGLHAHAGQGKDDEEAGHGGHDAPNWSRAKSATVLLACTVLYAVIAEILVDVVDVVLEGSGIPEKLLGVTLFALVPNTTEFMNAISFALNGNIALSMEIGSAYALQVCLIQIPAMLAFTAFYSIGKETMAHHAFTLVFPRWDAIAMLFSIFLMTYLFLESRANYNRGATFVLAYLALMGGFLFAPANRDTSDDPGFGGATVAFASAAPCTLPFALKAKAVLLSLFSR
ncbi:hypothetical protein JCM3775_006570 [Rhodotorula graminis]